MKKSIKKLKLCRETVRQLGGAEMGRVAGANTGGFFTCLDQTCGCDTSNGPVRCKCDTVIQCTG